MSRYLERAEHTTRLLEVNMNLMLDESSTLSDRRWGRLLHALGRPKRVKFNGDPYELARCLTFDSGNKSSLVSCIASARENARHVREQISTEQWQRVNSLFLEATRPETAAALAAASGSDATSNFMQSVMEALHQFQGVTDSTMSHGEGWQFIQVGRYLERAGATCLLIEAYHDDIWARQETTAPDGNEYLEWLGLLRSATAFEAYCKVYTADLTPESILEFLLLDEQFPHSIRFSIDTLQTALDGIQRESGKQRADNLHRLAGRLQASLSYTSIDEMLAGDILGSLGRIQRACGEVHNAIYQLYVDYSIQTALAG